MSEGKCDECDDGERNSECDECDGECDERDGAAVAPGSLPAASKILLLSRTCSSIPLGLCSKSLDAEAIPLACCLTLSRTSLCFAEPCQELSVHVVPNMVSTRQ